MPGIPRLSREEAQGLRLATNRCCDYCIPMPTLHPPSQAMLDEQLQAWSSAPLSYGCGFSLDTPPSFGFLIDNHTVCLGRGEAVFDAASQALRDWKMFPLWAAVHPPGQVQEPGRLVAMYVRILGLWWVNPCRILRRCDDNSASGARRTGFVYGTLMPHTECGEERFMVEMREDGTVWYQLSAFSRPQHWMAWVGFPLARWWQLRFVRDSQQAMVAATQTGGHER